MSKATETTSTKKNTPAAAVNPVIVATTNENVVDVSDEDDQLDAAGATAGGAVATATPAKKPYRRRSIEERGASFSDEELREAIETRHQELIVLVQIGKDRLNGREALSAAVNKAASSLATISA